jgi:hypothetical protein
LGMRLLCSHNPAMGDDVHARILSQNAIFTGLMELLNLTGSTALVVS